MSPRPPHCHNNHSLGLILDFWIELITVFLSMESGLYCCSNNLDSLFYSGCLLVDHIDCFTFSQLPSHLPNYHNLLATTRSVPVLPYCKERACTVPDLPNGQYRLAAFLGGWVHGWITAIHRCSDADDDDVGDGGILLW